MDISSYYCRMQIAKSDKSHVLCHLPIGNLWACIELSSAKRSSAEYSKPLCRQHSHLDHYKFFTYICMYIFLFFLLLLSFLYNIIPSIFLVSFFLLFNICSFLICWHFSQICFRFVISCFLSHILSPFSFLTSHMCTYTETIHIHTHEPSKQHLYSHFNS